MVESGSDGTPVRDGSSPIDDQCMSEQDDLTSEVDTVHVGSSSMSMTESASDWSSQFDMDELELFDGLDVVSRAVERLIERGNNGKKEVKKVRDGISQLKDDVLYVTLDVRVRDVVRGVVWSVRRRIWFDACMCRVTVMCPFPSSSSLSYHVENSLRNVVGK